MKSAAYFILPSNFPVKSFFKDFHNFSMYTTEKYNHPAGKQLHYSENVPPYFKYFFNLRATISISIGFAK